MEASFSKNEQTIIKSLLNRVTQQDHVLGYETEARFAQTFDGNAFQRVLQHYLQTSLRRTKYVSLIIQSPASIGDGTTQRTLHSAGVTIKSNKTELEKPLFCSLVPAKIVLCQEVSLYRKEEKIDNKTHQYGQKIRWRFMDGNVAIDLTQIMKAKTNTPSQFQIEVEVSYETLTVGNEAPPHHVAFTLQRFLYAMWSIHKLLCYNWPPMSRLLNHTDTQMVHGRIRKVIAGSDSRLGFPGVMPINVQGQESLAYLMTPNAPFAISSKLDGDRYLLFVLDVDHVYLIDRSMNIYQTFSGPRTLATTTKNVLLDVEWLARPNEFHVLDILAMDGTSLADNPKISFHSRLNLLKKFVDDQQQHGTTSAPTWIAKKQYITAHEKHVFLQTFDPQNTKHQDGLIFTPLEAPYKLWSTGNCFKWKLPEETSIDFYMKRRTNAVMQVTYGLFVRTDDKGKENYVAFYPLPTMTISLLHNQQQYDNTVTECVWDHHSHTFKPKRIREDKKVPNHLHVALETWKSILSPTLLCREEEHDDDIFENVEEKLGWQNDKVYHLLDMEALLLDMNLLKKDYYWWFNYPVDTVIRSTRLCLTHKISKKQHDFEKIFLGQFVLETLRSFSFSGVSRIERMEYHPYMISVTFDREPKKELPFHMTLDVYASWVSGNQKVEAPRDMQSRCDIYGVAINEFIPTCPYVPNMQYTFVPHIQITPSGNYVREIKAIRNAEKPPFIKPLQKEVAWCVVDVSEK